MIVELPPKNRERELFLFEENRQIKLATILAHLVNFVHLEQLETLYLVLHIQLISVKQFCI